jgi:hypothetical protein
MIRVTSHAEACAHGPIFQERRPWQVAHSPCVELDTSVVTWRPRQFGVGSDYRCVERIAHHVNCGKVLQRFAGTAPGQLTPESPTPEGLQDFDVEDVGDVERFALPE